LPHSVSTVLLSSQFPSFLNLNLHICQITLILSLLTFTVFHVTKLFCILVIINIIYCSEPQGMSYIETSNLDGETNLKIRQVLSPVTFVCWFNGLLHESLWWTVYFHHDYFGFYDYTDI